MHSPKRKERNLSRPVTVFPVISIFTFYNVRKHYRFYLLDSKPKIVNRWNLQSAC